MYFKLLNNILEETHSINNFHMIFFNNKKIIKLNIPNLDFVLGLINMRSLKITVVGDGEVGKTCLLNTYITGAFPQVYEATVYVFSIYYIKLFNLFDYIGSSITQKISKSMELLMKLRYGIPLAKRIMKGYGL